MLKEYFKALTGCFYDFDLYRRVIRTWKGLGFVYLLIVSFVAAVALVGVMAYNIHQIDEAQVNIVLDQVPEIVIDQGVAKTDVKTPYVVNILDNKVLFYMDLNDDPASDLEGVVDPMEMVTILKLYKQYLEIDYPDGSTKMISLHDFKNKTVLNKETLQAFFVSLKTIVPLALFPMVLLGTWFMYVVYVHVLTFISYIVTAFMQDEFDYHTRLRISAISLTPPVLFNLLNTVFLGHGMNLLVQLLIGVAYIYTMIRVNR